MPDLAFKLTLFKWLKIFWLVLILFFFPHFILNFFLHFLFRCRMIIYSLKETKNSSAQIVTVGCEIRQPFPSKNVSLSTWWYAIVVPSIIESCNKFLVMKTWALYPFQFLGAHHLKHKPLIHSFVRGIKGSGPMRTDFLSRSFFFFCPLKF